MLTELKEPIPHEYQYWSEGNKHLFKRYVQGYISKNRPDWELVRIEDKGRVAVLRKKED